VSRGQPSSAAEDPNVYSSFAPQTAKRSVTPAYELTAPIVAQAQLYTIPTAQQGIDHDHVQNSAHYQNSRIITSVSETSTASRPGQHPAWRTTSSNSIGEHSSNASSPSHALSNQLPLYSQPVKPAVPPLSAFGRAPPTTSASTVLPTSAHDARHLQFLPRGQGPSHPNAKQAWSSSHDSSVDAEDTDTDVVLVGGISYVRPEELTEDPANQYVMSFHIHNPTHNTRRFPPFLLV
jgi:hypothetical protein